LGKFVKDGGEEKVCGWLKDKFGMCWQVYPKALMNIMSNPEKAESSMHFKK
jgi:predicted 3-demethylubiquinone-9 3-methyltransferase (glyoxalase superfamily)